MTIKFASVSKPDGRNTDNAAECMNKLVTLMGGTGSMTKVTNSNYFISGTISLWGKTYKIGNVSTYGMTSGTIITAAYDDAQQVAVFYDSSRAPYTNCDINSNNNLAYKYYYLVLTPSGVHIPVNSNTSDTSSFITTCFNVGGGYPQPASSTLRANLTPLVVWGQDASPVFISSNLVMDTAGTIVTDTAGTKFVSLGNLLYIRDSAADTAAGTAVTCRVGMVSTLPAGSSATVKNVGTLNDVLLDFGIPQGPAGPQGDATKTYVDKAIADAIAKLKTDNNLK